MSYDAERVKIAKNSLDVLSKVFELGSNFSNLSNILKISGNLASAFPVVGAVLVLFESLLPDGKHEEILRCFEKLSNKIDQVRDDIKELKNVFTWEIAEQHYGVVVGRIELGLKLCVDIGKGSGQEKLRNEERLKEVCANQTYTLDLNDLVEGVTGNGLFKSSILDKFYEKTGGDRPRISTLATGLLRLVCGGMMVNATYETVMRGQAGAEEVAKEYDGQLKKFYEKAQSVLDKCVSNFKENMFNDLNSKLDVGGSNQGLASEISKLMRDKYDWLENFCLVYDDVKESDKHCFNGDRSDSLHRNGKCGIVFYRTKGEQPLFSGRYDEVCKMVYDVYRDFMGFQVLFVSPPDDAQEAHKNIVAKLAERGIGWTGCAVISRFAHLWLDGTVSTKVVRFDSHNATAIILLK